MQVNKKPITIRAIEIIERDNSGFAISFPDCCVRKMENIISTTMPPTYTTICTAAINSTSIQKYKPAMLTREHKSQMAERNIFLVNTDNRPLPKMQAERM